MQCNFVVGQKVVAVKKESPTERDIQQAEVAKRIGVVFPKPGETYTVRNVFTAARADGEVIVCLHLVEVVNNPRMKFGTGVVGEIGFSAACFRPVVERKTDISIFTAMLTEQKQPVNA
jgi:hypothetical protein